MANKYFEGNKEIDGPRLEGDPLRRYYFTILDTPVHFHDDFEILRVNKGVLRYTVDGELITAYNDDIVLISPFMLHSGVVKDEDFAVSVYVVSPNFICSHNDEYINKYFEPLLSGYLFLPSVIRKGENGHKELLSCINKIDEIEKRKETGFELLLRNELSLFFSILYKYDYLVSENRSNAKSNIYIKKAIAYIVENYNRHISNKEIADYTGFSESHFMALFKKYCGTSFVNYLNRIRIEKAIELLKSTDLLIIDIAEKTGFNSVSLFNRTFKKTTGKTPKEYRNKIKEL